VEKDEYRSRWERVITEADAAADPVVRKIKAGEALDDAEQDALTRRLNESENYFNEDNLRHAYRTREGTLIDFVRAALGLTRVKSREEQIDDNFRAWLVANQFSAEQADLLSMLKARGVANGKVEVADLFQPPLDHFNAPERATQLFGPQIRDIVADLNTAVFEATA
jgi:type I restriction enzyme R subunit